MVPADIFAPITIRGHSISSRLFLAPINTGFALSGRVSPLMLQFHRQRSSPSVGIGMVGNVAVETSGAANGGTLLLESDLAIESMRTLVHSISVLGSTPGIQLAYSPAGLGPSSNWVAKNPLAEQERLTALLDSFTDSALREVIGHFVNASRLAVEAGFEVVQVHAAHGYLLSLLLSPVINRRTGDYRLEGPWLDQFVERTRRSIRDSILSFRLSLFSGIRSDPQLELDFTFHVSKHLSHLGVDLLDYSAGVYTVDKRLIYPGLEKGIVPYHTFVRPIAACVSATVSMGGNIMDILAIPDLPGNVAVTVGRALIADPDFATKSSRGQYDDIVRCERRSRCHYFSRGRQSIECGINLNLGKGIQT